MLKGKEMAKNNTDIQKFNKMGNWPNELRLTATYSLLNRCKVRINNVKQGQNGNEHVYTAE